MNYVRRIGKFLLIHRLPLVVTIHFFLVILSNFLAFWLRFDGNIPPQFGYLMVRMLPWLLLLRAPFFFIYRLYKGLWKYTGIRDLFDILSATFLGSFSFYLLVHVILGLKGYPRSVFVVDSILLVFFLGGVRLPWRIYRELQRTKRKGKRVLIYGAGDAGEMIIRDMIQHPNYGYDPIGFIDDNPLKVGQSIHGIRVFGTRKMLPKIIPEQKVEEVMVAIPSAQPSILREVLQCLQPFNIPIKTLPNIRDILDEKITINQIRNLSVEDLIRRVPVDLDLTAVKRMLKDKRVLVTGAGGSIGSELCRQILKMEPKELVLYERYENGLYEIVNELIWQGHEKLIRPIIGDITNKEHVDRIFRTSTPEVVFHSAAHKHVPMMEANPCEAIRNNVTGTRILSKAALRHGAGKFVLISTDKAVHPTSVMGASKSVAEMMIHTIADHSMTSFVAVRFGNVLASHGSVVPLFLDQIKRGGPVTVTHPEMQRYFMLIPEAVELVLLAAAMGGDAETYVLQMGEQINVTEMARNLIRLSGFVPDSEIPIVYTGLRPGEKLFEELVAQDEIAEPSSIPAIVRIRRRFPIDTVLLRRKVRELERASVHGDSELVLQYLKEVVPSFHPNGSNGSDVFRAEGSVKETSEL